MASMEINRKINRNFLKVKTYKDFYEKILGPSTFHGIIERKERCDIFLKWVGIFKKYESQNFIVLETTINKKNLKREDMKYIIKKYFKDKGNPFI